MSKAEISTEKRFIEAFEVYSDALFRHSFFRISDREKALDLVSETFMKTWDYVVKGKEVDDFRPFLYRVLNNLIIDEYRKKKAVSLDEFLEKEGASEGDVPALHFNPKEEIELHLDAKEAIKAITSLPEKYRQVITMRFVDGFSPKEISELVEESENAVSVRIHRGLARLRETLHYD
ncbi:MAG: sigma-70 family RNA polymerase sigma factor [Patescibacteria group bacterium]